MISAVGSFFLGAGASVYHGLSNLHGATFGPAAAVTAAPALKMVGAGAVGEVVSPLSSSSSSFSSSSSSLTSDAPLSAGGGNHLEGLMDGSGSFADALAATVAAEQAAAHAEVSESVN